MTTQQKNIEILFLQKILKYELGKKYYESYFNNQVKEDVLKIIQEIKEHIWKKDK